MSAPEKVRLKRKRQDDPLEALVLTKVGGQDDVPGGSSQKRLKYKPLDSNATSISSNKSAYEPRSRSPVKNAVKRLFRLRRSPQAGTRSHASNGATTSMPVFEERYESAVREQTIPDGRSYDVSDANSQPLQPLKRPGKGSSLGFSKDRIEDLKAKKARSANEHHENMQALADLLHQASLEELAKLSRPATTSKPRLSPQQARNRHERNVASRETTPTEDAVMTDADEFVYDTYVLEPAAEDDEVLAANVGFLVIDKDDEEFWLSFMEDENHAEHEAHDEDDENAEDHYAADYPEDEDAEDDDDSRIYNSRNADDEEYDLRDESDEDQSDDLTPSSSQKAHVVRKWEKILAGQADD